VDSTRGFRPLALKITPINKLNAEDTEYKSILYEIFSFSSKLENSWLQPLVQLNSNGEPNLFLRFLAHIYGIVGKNHFGEIWSSKAFATLSGEMDHLNDKGGHPIDEITALTYILLVSGFPNEDIQQFLQQYELETTKTTETNRKVLDRVRKRITRVKNKLEEMGISIQYQGGKYKGFFDKAANKDKNIIGND
jgi:hypothetical protein